MKPSAMGSKIPVASRNCGDLLRIQPAVDFGEKDLATGLMMLDRRLPGFIWNSKSKH